MSENEVKNKFVDDIMDYFKKQLLSEIEEHSASLPVFNVILDVMKIMNDNNNCFYSLSDLDNTLFDSLMDEVSNVLFLN